MDHASRIRVLNSSKSAKNWKNDNAFIIYRHDVIANFFWLCSWCWLIFLVTSLSFMAVSLLFLEFWQFLFIGDLTRNLETENTPAWVLSNIWRLEPVRCHVLHVSPEKLLNARFTAFTVSKLLRENQHGGGNTLIPKLRFKVQLN